MIFLGHPGDVNTSCEYNPKQMLEHNIPSNVPVGTCQKQPEFDCYNKNLFTQIIQPGVYARSEVVEPTNWNIGISWDQQFEPVTCEVDCNGGHTYVSHDPRVIDLKAPQEKSIETYIPKATPDNVYDPRLTGYGTSYRSYIDPLTGRPKFYYDDVDVVRQPNYIVRSKIDHLPWADSYGPMKTTEDIISTTDASRAFANVAWTRNSVSFRDSLMERYMRKYNQQIAPQRKQAPLRRDNGSCNMKCKA